MKKPNMAPLYGAAFGFNTDRRVKPVHFATGFFVSLLGQHYPAKLLNHVVAFADGKELSGEYELKNLHDALKTTKHINSSIGTRELHALRKHLRCLADNDEAVFPAYSGKAGFGCDYSTAAYDILTRTKDNDGFSGHFVRTVLEQSKDGQFILSYARQCINERQATLRQVFEPILDPDQLDYDMASRYETRFGELDSKRLKAISKRLSDQTKALKTLCENTGELVASETKLRFLIMGLCVWLFRYLIEEALSDTDEKGVLLVDYIGVTSSRMRGQSRWSYARLREALVISFSRFEQEGRFEDCADAWQHVQNELNGRPKFEEFYRELALRSGLAQPRASRVPSKHFEPQPDTLRILLLSVLHEQEGLVPISLVLQRLYETWGLVFGGRSDDSELLNQLGYQGLDEDQNLTPNYNALIDLLTELGLATRYSDGLVMCHSRTRF